MNHTVPSVQIAVKGRKPIQMTHREAKQIAREFNEDRRNCYMQIKGVAEDMVREGHSARHIAFYLDISPATVHSIIKQMDMSPREKGTRLFHDKKNKKTNQNIADSVGVNIRTVERWRAAVRAKGIANV